MQRLDERCLRNDVQMLGCGSRTDVKCAELLPATPFTARAHDAGNADDLNAKPRDRSCALTCLTRRSMATVFCAPRGITMSAKCIDGLMCMS